jgi:hypothetical protein
MPVEVRYLCRFLILCEVRKLWKFIEWEMAGLGKGDDRGVFKRWRHAAFRYYRPTIAASTCIYIYIYIVRDRRFSESASNSRVKQRRTKCTTGHKSSVRRDVKEYASDLTEGSNRHTPGGTKDHYAKRKYKTAPDRHSDKVWTRTRQYSSC